MGTTIVVAVLIIVVLLFIWLSATLISRQAEKVVGHDRCAFCGAALEQIGQYSTHCPACGRQQPWDADAVES